MNSRLLATILFLAAFPGYALGQNPELQPEPTPMTPQELTESVIAMQSQLRELLARVDATNSTPVNDPAPDLQKELDRVKEDLQQLSTVIEGNTENLGAVVDQQKTMADKLVEVSDQLSQMKEDQLAFADQIKEVAVQLGQVRGGQQEFQTEISDQISEINTQLGQISRDAGGSQTLRFDNIQDDATIRDFRSLVEETTPKTGTLVVKNKMSSGQYLFVNRVEYYIGPGQEEAITVPRGNVSTQLPGQKIVNWTVSGPDEEVIQIVPERQPIRTTTAVSFSPPVVYNSPPVYFESASYISMP